MSYRTVPGSQSRYALISFDAAGNEREDDPDAAGQLFSAKILADISASRPTDIFLLCHGWKGDVPAAIEQYDLWIAAMENSSEQGVAEKLPDFKPYRIGVHWPSQPWGDEELGPASFDISHTDPIGLYVQRLGDRPGLREQVAKIFEAAARDPTVTRLPADAEQAYNRINSLLAEVGASGPGASPAADREPFDPQAYFLAALDDKDPSFGDWDWGGVLAPLRQLSFWTMKARARTVGEGGMHSFLTALQDSEAGANARIHLMGHSFGCIVVSAMLCGPGTGVDAKHVTSLALVQGALSHWSYCKDIPAAPGRPGYFQRLLASGVVEGPIVTTRSTHDKALGRFYPLGAGAADQVDFGAGDYPRYGALGTFGAQALTPAAIDLAMKPVGQAYAFQSGHLYNIDASDFIRKGDGASGAHNDIAGPEVAHLVWSAALAG